MNKKSKTSKTAKASALLAILPLIVSVVTGIISIRSCGIAQNALSISKNSSEQQIIYNKLEMLKTVIQERQEYIEGWTTITDIRDFADNLQSALSLSDNATIAVNYGNYGEAEYYINRAYEFLTQIPPTVVSPGVVTLSQVVNAQGVFTQSIDVKSPDDKLEIAINKDTIGKTKKGTALSTISVTPLTMPPAWSTQASIVGLAYDFEPKGANFSPPITVTVNYDPTKVPAAIAEKDLVIAYFDNVSNNWVELANISVDPVIHAISGKASHFTAFAVLAYMPRPTPTPTPTPTGGSTGLIIGIIAAVIVVGIAVWLVMRRRTS